MDDMDGVTDVVEIKRDQPKEKKLLSSSYGILKRRRCKSSGYIPLNRRMKFNMEMAIVQERTYRPFQVIIQPSNYLLDVSKVDAPYYMVVKNDFGKVPHEKKTVVEAATHSSASAVDFQGAQHPAAVAAPLTNGVTFPSTIDNRYDEHDLIAAWNQSLNLTPKGTSGNQVFTSGLPNI